MDASQIILQQGQPPAVPAATQVALYCKDDGVFYYKANDGVEHAMNDTVIVQYGGIGVSFEASQQPAANGVYSYIMPYGFTVQTNATGSGFYNAVNPSVVVSVSLMINGTEFGTLSVDSSGSPTWTVTQTVISAGDRISFVFGSQDANWAGVVISLRGVKQ